MKVVGICLVLGLLMLGCYAQTTTLCRESFHQMLPITLLQMEDYTGKSPYDMGNYDGCQGLNSTAVHYCVVQTEIETGKVHSIANVYMGLCVPTQCDENTLETLLRDGVADLNISYVNFNLPELADMTFTCVPRGLYKFTWGAIVSIVLFTLIGVLVILGTTVDYFESEAIARMKRTSRFSEDRAPLVSSQGDTAEITRLPGEEGRNVHLNAEYAPKRKPGKFMEFLKCFAIGPNIGFLVKDNRGGEPGLAHMNGLRCLMMFWIILSHTFAYVNAPVGFDNIRVITQDLLERVSFQVIPAGELAVDGFFYLSGFLVAYMVLKEMKHSKNQRIPWGLFYFHRYWRLTPVYGCIILFYTTITPFLIYGPFAHLYREQKTELCVKYWWSNLLYINNFYPADSNNQCFGWGWYLANDMQFFIISPLFILLFKRNRSLAFAVITLLATASLATMGSIVGKNQLEPLGMNEHWNSQAYGKPYTRIPPYLVGLGFAFLVQYENIDLLRKWYIRWFVYAVSFTFTTCCTYLTYGYWNEKGWDNWQNVVYSVTSRSLFVMGLACFTYACYKGHGGILNTVLSAYFWLPLARLTYTAYLTHPVIIFVINYSTTTIFHYSSIYMAVRYCSHLLLAYSVAMVFHLSIEKPTANVERIILPPRGKH